MDNLQQKVKIKRFELKCLVILIRGRVINLNLWNSTQKEEFFLKCCLFLKLVRVMYLLFRRSIVRPVLVLKGVRPQLNLQLLISVVQVVILHPEWNSVRLVPVIFAHIPQTVHDSNLLLKGFRKLTDNFGPILTLSRGSPVGQ